MGVGQHLGEAGHQNDADRAFGDGQHLPRLGVVGQQPLLKPGETFEYTSGCQLDTPVGTMRGSFQMTAEDGVQFEATIDEFTLSIPRVPL